MGKKKFDLTIGKRACLDHVVSHTLKDREMSLAHMLAQYSKSLVSYVAWVETCPSHTKQACAQDIAVATIS